MEQGTQVNEKKKGSKGGVPEEGQSKRCYVKGPFDGMRIAGTLHRSRARVVPKYFSNAFMFTPDS